jgi:hypothetical protein
MGFEIEGRKVCFSIFFQWLQSIKSVHLFAAKLILFSIPCQFLEYLFQFLFLSVHG